jgi:hypothetical protein
MVREFKEMNTQISTLQQQVDALYSNLSSFRNSVDNGVAVDSSYGHRASRSLSVSTPMASHASFARPQTKHPKFHGPTSAVFNLGVAKSSLQSMGIAAPEENLEDGGFTNDPTPATSPPPMHTITSRPLVHSSKDPLWSMSKEEALRLVSVWHEEMGVMYPVVSVSRMESHINMLYSFMDAVRRTGLVLPDMPGADTLSDDETNILKLILSIALTLEGSGSSELGSKIFASVSATVESLLLRPPDLKCLEMLVLAVSHPKGQTNYGLLLTIPGDAPVPP